MLYLNLINFILPLFLIVLAFFSGRIVEFRHFRSLKRREKRLSYMLATNVKRFPGGSEPAKGGKMIVAEVVIATDYVKSILAKLRKILGGELRSYRSLMIRARREALVRMKEKAEAEGYNALCNIRLEFSNIGGGMPIQMAMVAIVANCTAYQMSRNPQ